jgi:hypothetical protein
MNKLILCIYAIWQFRLWTGLLYQNIVFTEAKLRSIYNFGGDTPVHKLTFGPKCHELFVILYTTDHN